MFPIFSNILGHPVFITNKTNTRKKKISHNVATVDVAFVHPFQEFLIKLVTASGKFILDINWNSCNHIIIVERYGNQIRYL